MRAAICDTIVAGLCHDDAELETALERLGCLSEAPESTPADQWIDKVPTGALGCPRCVASAVLK